MLHRTKAGAKVLLFFDIRKFFNKKNALDMHFFVFRHHFILLEPAETSYKAQDTGRDKENDGG